MKQRKLSILLSYTGQAIHILTAMFYTPVMLKILGQAEYGTYQLVESIVSNLSLFSFGFGTSYVRFYAKYRVKDDEESIARLNGMFMTVFLVLGVLAFVSGVVMVMNAGALLGNRLADEEIQLATVLMKIMVMNIVISFPISVFDGIITAHEELIFQKVLMVLQFILNPFIALPMLLLGYGSIGMVLVTTLLLLIKATCNIIFCIKKLHVRFVFKNFELHLLKDLSRFTFFIFLNQVIEQINWSVDRFLLGHLKGAISISIYSIAAQINTLYVQFSSAVSEAFVPKINMMVAAKKTNEDDSAISKLFIKVGRVQFLILGLILSGFILFGKEFIILWVGNVYHESYYVALFLLVPITIPLIEGLGVQIQRAENKHQARSVVYFFIALGNVLISIPLIKWNGAIGAAIGTCIALVAGHGLFMNIYYQYRLNIDIIGFFRSIITMIPPYIIPVIIGVLLNRCFFISQTWISLFFKIVCYTLSYGISMYLFGMNIEEKALAKSIIMKTKHRK